MYGAETNVVFVYGFRTQFGGGKSTGFGLIYDNLEAAKKLLPKYMQVRVRTATGKECRATASGDAAGGRRERQPAPPLCRGA
jgi:ribosomal protein S24E